MTRSRYTVNYIRCSVEELKNFVLRRGLLLSVEPYRTSALVCLLMDANRTSRFSFEDLPAELRIEVYRHILRFRETAKGLRCWTQILRASKSTHREAKDIIWDCNVFSVLIRTAKNALNPASDSRFAVSVNGSKIPEAASNLFVQKGRWPPYLRQAHHLNVLLDLPDPAAVTMSQGITLLDFSANHYLYTLCSFLQGEHRLKTLEINVEVEKADDAQYGPDDYRQLLNPLRTLGAISSFALCTPVDGVAEAIQEAMRDHTAAGNTQNALRRWQRIHLRAREMINLAEAVVDGGKRGVREMGPDGAMYKIDQHISMLERDWCQPWTIFDKHSDVLLGEHLDRLQQLLDGGVLKDVRVALEKRMSEWQATMEKLEQDIWALLL